MRFSCCHSRTLGVVLLLFSLAVSLGCTTVKLGTGTPIEVPAMEIDAALSDEVLPLTQALMQSQPVNPPGDEERPVRILSERLTAAGIAVDVAPFDGDTRLNLLATLPADAPSGEGALVLLCHTDVVPAQASEWQHPPFAARVVGDVLVGRGSVDMLGMCAIEALTLVALKNTTGRTRDLLFVAVGDEEVSSLGMVAAFRSWPQLAKAQWALGEASFLADGALKEGELLAAIAVAEKGIFQFDLVTAGKSGHGSNPPADSATARLTRAVDRVLRRDDPLTLTPATEQMLGAIGQGRGGVVGLVMQSPALLAAVGRGTLDGEEARPLVHNTCALTRLTAGYKTNVIPAQARATFDCRLLPGTTPGAMRDQLLLTINDPQVKMETLLAVPPLRSAADTVFIDVVKARVLKEHPEAIVVPSLSRGFSDLHHFRLRGVESYGLIPFVVRKDELASIHGKDERLRVRELPLGLSRLVDMAHTLVTLPATKSP